MSQKVHPRALGSVSSSRGNHWSLVEMARAAAAAYDGDSTETESDSEVATRTKRELKREAQEAAQALGVPRESVAATAPREEAPGLGDPVAAAVARLQVPANSILAVAAGPPLVQEEPVVVGRVAAPPVVAPLAMPLPVATQATPSAVATSSPPARATPNRCKLCKEKFSNRSRREPPASDGLSCACCQREGLDKMREFSQNQRQRDESVRRCRTCAAGGSEPLTKIRWRLRNPEAEEKKRQAIEKRKATIARKKLEKQQQEQQEAREKEARARARAEAEAQGIIFVDSDSSDGDSALDEDQATEQMEKGVRDIMTAIRSIHRRSQLNNLDGPYREQYELELLTEERKLHEKAVTLCIQNPDLYDRACEKLLVIDGKVKLGERDHEQGEFDGDKPNHRVTKTGKKRVIRKTPDTGALERCEVLLDGAKATAKQRREMQSTEEPPPKRVKRVDEDGIEMAVLNRPRRRVAKPASYVIDSD